MKFHNLRKRIASLMALFAMVVCCSAASAQEAKLYIPDFTIDNYDPVEVNIMLDNQIDITAFSFKVDLPAGVEIVPGSAVKTNRYNQGQQFTFRNNTFACFSMQNYAFTGKEGSVGTFKVKATPGTLGKKKDLSLRLYDMAIVAANSEQNIKINEQFTTVTTEDNSDPVSLVLSYEQSATVVNPSGVLNVSVALDNDAPVQGMEMQIVLPEGFTFVTEGGNIFTQTARMSGGATITPKTTGNVTRVVIADLLNNEMLPTGSGTFMSFSVAAPENFDAENAEILIEKVQASVKFRTINVNSISIPLSSGKIAYDKALLEVSKLEAALTEALSTIETSCPDVKDLFPGTGISEQIEALKSAIEAAYAGGNLTADYDEVMAPAAEIEAAIAKLVDDAKAAQASHDAEVAAEKARQEAYTNGCALVAQLNSELAAALETIATDCPDVKDNFQGETIKESIENLQKALDAALEDKTIVENYDSLVAPATEISAAITKLVEDAKAAQKAYEDEQAAAAALENALVKANAEVASLKQLLSEAMTTISEECPDVKDLFPATEIESQIAALESAIQTAYEDKTLAVNYDEVMAPTSVISANIAALVTAAKEAQASHDAAVAARQEAYKNGCALVAQLNSELAAALETIATDCPDVKDNFKGETIKESIENLQKALDAALEDKTIVENYDSLVAPAVEISAAITKLVVDAKAAQKAYEDEQAAAAALEEALTKANEVITVLKRELFDTMFNISLECADVKDQFPDTEIQNQITTLESAIKAAYKDKTLAVNYDEVMAPVASIRAAMAKLLEDARAAQKAYAENAALERARTNANATLAALDKALADALEEIDSECPDVKHLYSGVSIQQQITVLRNAVNAAYADKTLVANYDEVMAPAASIQESIAKLVSDAKAAQKAIDDAEKARKEYNQKAYDADLAVIAELQNELDAAKNEIIEKYPEYDYTASYNKISKAIAALKAKADKEFERVADEGKYAYDLDTMQVEDMIEKMLNEARASGIDIILDDLNGDYRIFTIDGRQVPELQHGKVNIIIKADGTKHKVFVK